jgi:O-antigen/teichoic acid export membrane protein
MDYLVIGRFLGVKALGFYTIAYQLTTLPLNKINPVLTQFALPVMSLFQDENDRVTNVYQRTMQLIALVTFPLLVGLGLMAAPAVRVIFGPQWDDSVRLVQALTIMGIGKSLIGVGGSVFMSKGRADLGFWQSVIVAVVSAVVFYFTVQVGVPTLAWSYSALMVVQFAALLLVMKWLVGFRFGPFFRLMALPLAASAVMAAALVAAERALSFTSAASWPAVAQLAVLVTIGAVAYVGVLLALDRKLVATAVVAFFKRGEAR